LAQFIAARFATIVIGFIAAVLASSVTIGAAMTTLTVWADPGLMADPLSPLMIALILAFYPAIGFAIFSFLPFCLMVLVAEIRSIRIPIYYAVMGGLCVLAGSALLFWVTSSRHVDAHEMPLQIVPLLRSGGTLFVFGLIAGLAYWAVAGRSAGRREPTSLGPSGS